MNIIKDKVIKKMKYSAFGAFGRVSLIMISLMAVMFSCKETGGKEKKMAMEIDTSVNFENAFLKSFLDSNDVADFLSRAALPAKDSAQISDFYKSRNYEFAWFDSSGLTEHAVSFISLYRNYRNKNHDSALVNKKLDAAVDHIMEDSLEGKNENKLKVSTELGLTGQFFKYSEKAYGAGPINPEDLGWFIPKKKINIRAFLDSVVSNKSAKISEFEPVHRMFTPLHEYLEKYSAIEKDGGWPQIPSSEKAYTIKDSGQAIALLKKRLQMVGDLPDTDTGNVYTAQTKQGVINFQRRFGMNEDGVVGKNTLAEMNVPVTERIKQIAVNIERIKWIPQPGNGRYIVANIPAFKVYVFDSGHLQWDMKVVVGDQAHSTVVFSDVLETIAFSPYWNVPYSIVKNEMANKSSAWYSRNNMEIVGHYSDGLPQVRQLPGPKNSLGRVKFLFPNSYAIYFHDTPAKWLFNQTDRAASHGCIRLADAKKMAAWLLDYDPDWTMDSIENAMSLDKEKQVKLKNPVPVYIVYFTAWVDRNGKLNFRDDIYGHDEEMMERLFEEQ